MDERGKRRPASSPPARRRKKTDKKVVYTQPKPFNRMRFLLQLATVLAVVLALLFGMSIFFKANRVEVSGTLNIYEPWQIEQAADILEGENLLTLNKRKISARIQQQLHYVDTVQVAIRLPDTVVIHVTELNVVYAAQDQLGHWWLLNRDGKIVDRCDPAALADYSRITGVQLDTPEVGAMAVAYEPPQTPDENGVTPPVTVYARERLAAALQVMKNMESTGFITAVNNVNLDVTDIVDITLKCDSRFEILLGDSTVLSEKLTGLKQLILEMDKSESGILDVSAGTLPIEIGHTGF